LSRLFPARLRKFAIVTGAFSYTGRAIAERLLAEGQAIRTLTRREARTDPLARRIESAPLQFRDAAALTAALRGALVLYNTYWIRFERGESTFARAVENTRVLFHAAAVAGVQRIVHVSVTNAALDSPFPYFRGKAALERELKASGLSHAIVRPTLVFGREDILVNNIAWILRRLPVFLVPGDGTYRVQPVSVADTAAICVAAATETRGQTLDAAGPDTFTFEELVRRIAAAVGSRARIVHSRPRLGLRLSRLVGALRRDVLLTSDELGGLTGSLLVSAEPPRGRDRFDEWLADEADRLGRRYVSELARNFRPYAPL
jgi:NADH dehydrogenase